MEKTAQITKILDDLNMADHFEGVASWFRYGITVHVVGSTIELGAYNDWDGAMRAVDAFVAPYTCSMSSGLSRALRFQGASEFDDFVERLGKVISVGALETAGTAIPDRSRSDDDQIGYTIRQAIGTAPYALEVLVSRGTSQLTELNDLLEPFDSQSSGPRSGVIQFRDGPELVQFMDRFKEILRRDISTLSDR